MRRQQPSRQIVEAQTGYAADAAGRGVAYVRLAAPAGDQLLRVPFAVRRVPELNDREVGFGAVTAVAGELRRRGFGRVAFGLADAQLLEDLDAHRAAPAALVLPYVRLRCALNQFADTSVRHDPAAADLAARARAEVALHVAA